MKSRHFYLLTPFSMTLSLLGWIGLGLVLVFDGLVIYYVLIKRRSSDPWKNNTGKIRVQFHMREGKWRAVSFDMPIELLKKELDLGNDTTKTK